jgi:hypothetical protein
VTGDAKQAVEVIGAEVAGLRVLALVRVIAAHDIERTHFAEATVTEEHRQERTKLGIECLWRVRS